MLIRLLLLGALFLGFLLGIVSLLRKITRRFQDPPHPTEKLVPCKRCGLFLPLSHAKRYQGEIFCREHIPSSSKGFLLIECLIVGALLLSALVLCTVSFAPSLRRQHTETVLQHLFYTLQWMRLEALERSHPLRLCGTEDFQHCSASWKGILLVTHTHPPKRLHHYAFPSIAVESNRKMIVCTPRGYCSPTTLTVGNHRLIVNSKGRLRIERGDP